jgi:hypothetical protein
MAVHAQEIASRALLQARRLIVTILTHCGTLEAHHGGLQLKLTSPGCALELGGLAVPGQLELRTVVHDGEERQVAIIGPPCWPYLNSCNSSPSRPATVFNEPTEGPAAPSRGR